MRTAQEVASDLILKMEFNAQILDMDDKADVLVKALTAFRNEALEEAAKITEAKIEPEGHYGLCYDCDCHGICPQEYYPPLIRALKK